VGRVCHYSRGDLGISTSVGPADVLLRYLLPARAITGRIEEFAERIKSLANAIDETSSSGLAPAAFVEADKLSLLGRSSSDALLLHVHGPCDGLRRRLVAPYVPSPPGGTAMNEQSKATQVDCTQQPSGDDVGRASSVAGTRRPARWKTSRRPLQWRDRQSS